MQVYQGLLKLTYMVKHHQGMDVFVSQLFNTFGVLLCHLSLEQVAFHLNFSEQVFWNDADISGA